MKIKVLQRCNVFGIWPEYAMFQTPLLRIGFDSPTRYIIGKICVRTYKNRTSFSAAPQIASGLFEHSYPEMERSTGFYIGDVFYSEKIGDAVGKMEMKSPYEGQIDIFLELEHGIDAFQAGKFMPAYVTNLVFMIGKYTGDLISPVGEVCTYSTAGNKSEIAVRLNSGGERSRIAIDPQIIIQTVGDTVKFSKGRSSEDIVKSGIASRRIISARKELDVIDQFCDYWEACEHLCSGPQYESYKDKSMKIAVGLAPIYGISVNDVWETLTKPIYEIRNEVVHEYIIDEAKVRYPLSMLDDMASNLLLRFLGSPIKLPDKVTSYLDDIRSGTVPMMPRNNRPSSYRLG